MDSSHPNAAVEEAHRAKSLFLATMGHELRTPVTGILGILDLLTDTPMNAEQQRLMKILQGSADNLLKILNAMGNFVQFEAALEEPAGAPDADVSILRPLRILVAEDNPVNQMLLMHALNRRGHQVQLAKNGQEAVTAGAAAPFDIILMDMQMPVMDGGQAARAIRALPPPMGDIPIIGISADAMPRGKEEYLRAGLNDYMTKPIQWDALSTAMERIAGNQARAGR